MAFHEDANRNIVTKHYKNESIVILLIYCVSGTLLTLINKMTIFAFPYVNILLLTQNFVIVILLVLTFYFFPNRFGSLPSLNMSIVKLCMPLTLTFVLILLSNLFSLLYVSMATVIVMCSLSTLFVVLFECIVINYKMNGLSIATLIGMLAGAIFYAKHDSTFNVKGYTWLCINIFSTSIYQIYLKKMAIVLLTKDIGSIGIFYHNNLISLPVLLLLAYIMNELTSRFDLISSLDMRSINLVLFSSVLAFLVSISTFVVNRRNTATTVIVIDNINRMLIIILSEIFVESTLNLSSIVGAFFVVYFGWLYSQSSKYFSKMLFILFIILLAAFEYTDINIPINKLVSRSQTNILKNNSMDQEFQTFIDKAKIENKDIYEEYLPFPTSSQPIYRISPGIFIKNTIEYQLPEICVKRNASIWRRCNPPRCKANVKAMKLDYPRTTVKGENTGEFINNVLEIAWGSNPPSIDLYLRSGCVGLLEMKYLIESIEIFWPRFLGSVVIILDVGDEAIPSQLLPLNPSHHYVIAFEHVPCLSPRVFNQYSYLNLDRHCTADYVVTIDSDCVFHAPVTPDLIFRHGKVILASSRTFQGDMWVSSINSMMGVGLYDGHYMVTQPVTFSLSTFPSFRKWLFDSQSVCYEDRLSELPPNDHPNFCWMCQLGTYLERGHSRDNEHNKYWFLHLDNAKTQPFLRYSTHVTHEPYKVSPPIWDPIIYGKSVNEVIKQGLCRAFGSSVLSICAQYSDFTYLNLVTFLYAHMEIQTANQTTRNDALNSYLKRLSRVTAILLDRLKD